METLTSPIHIHIYSLTHRHTAKHYTHAHHKHTAQTAPQTHCHMHTLRKTHIHTQYYTCLRLYQSDAEDRED